MKLLITIAVACVSVLYWRSDIGDARATRPNISSAAKTHFASCALVGRTFLNSSGAMGSSRPTRFVWREGVIAPYRFVGAMGSSRPTCKLLSSLESRQVLQLDSLTVYQLYNNQPFKHSNIRTFKHSLCRGVALWVFSSS